MPIDVNKYLERIGCEFKPKISLEYLNELQSSHQLNVPFENLDVFTGKKKILEEDLLYEQIVINRRGGWCHELNGLFSILLSKLGFNVKIVSCLHFDRDKNAFNTVDFDHMALVVTIDQAQYLVDVGYGWINQHFKPLKMCTNTIFNQVCMSYIFSFRAITIILNRSQFLINLFSLDWRSISFFP